MTGTFAQITNVTLMAIAAVVALSMVIGAVDLIRQPGWAWRTAGEPKAICLLLVLLLPGVGLAIYVFGARPKVIAIAATGRAANLPFERFADRGVLIAEDTRLIQALALPTSIGSFGEPRVDRAIQSSEPRLVSVAPSGVDRHTDDGRDADADADANADAGSESTGSNPTATAAATAAATVPETEGLHFPGGMGRPYHPRQRASFDESESLAAVAAQILGATQEMDDRVHSGRRVQANDSNDTASPPQASGLSPFTRPGDAAVLDRSSGTGPATMSSGQPISKTLRSGGSAKGLPMMAPMQVALGSPRIDHTMVEDTARDHGDLLVDIGQGDTVAAQWMDDPIGRHQYRYWDGGSWTENVCDDGAQSRDSALN